MTALVQAALRVRRTARSSWGLGAAIILAAFLLAGFFVPGTRPLGWGHAVWFGVWLMVFGIGRNIVAAAIQASGTVRLNLGVPLDHNGVFHLVQMVAIVVLVAGVGRSLGNGTDSPSTESATDAV